MADNRRNGSTRSRGARILCLVLVGLMLLGSASTVILFLVAGMTSVSATGYDEPVMSIGIQYGDTASSSYRTYSDSGYTVRSQKSDGDRSAVELGTVADKTLIVAPCANLAPSGTGFTVTGFGITVGGYRLQIKTEYKTYAAAFDAASKLTNTAAEKGYQVFPAYISGKFYIRIGCFVDTAAAEAARSAAETIAGSTVSVIAPSDNAVTVLTASGQVRFEYENGTAEYLSLSPAGSGDVYIRGEDDHIYEGAFMYRRSGNAITVINMIGLEAYIEGVLPYEISPSWHLEAQKAFAIAARSYAVGNKGKHYKDYGFDLCNGTNCQVYKGAGSVTDAVRLAVEDTAGAILTYENSVATLYYSSSTGGSTVSAKDCWGGSGAPYLSGVSTPWERYADYNNGTWISEVSPEELCETLRSKGYTDLTGGIATVEIVGFAANSDYVKSLKFTDTSGNSVTITNTDKIRTTLSKYLKSANFLVGKDSVSYTVSKVTASTEASPYSSQSMTSFNLISSVGRLLAGLKDSPKVITGSGRDSITASSEFVITANNANGEGSEIAKGYTTSYETKTVTAETSGNFIFAGKGWGHGVGLSQYGTKDLAEFGYTYEQILKAYVPAAKLSSVTDLG